MARRTFSRRRDRVVGVAVEPGGTEALIVASRAVTRWDLVTGAELEAWPRSWPAVANAAALSSYGRRLVLGNWDGTLTLWDVTAGRELGALTEGVARAQDLAFTPDGRWLVTAGHDGVVRRWDLATGALAGAFVGHAGEALAVAVAPDGRRAVSGGEDGTARLWDLATGRELQRLVGQGDVTAVAVSPDGQRVLSGHRDGHLSLWEAATGWEVRRFGSNPADVRRIAFSADGQQAVSWSWSWRAGSDRSTFKVWDLGTGREHGAFSRRTMHVALAPDGSAAAGAGGLATARIWEVATGRVARTLELRGSGALGLAFSPDSRLLLAASGDGTLGVFDVATGGAIAALATTDRFAWSVALSPDGRWAATVGDAATVRLWELATGRELVRLVAFTGGDWLAVVPDGHYHGSTGGEARLQVQTGPTNEPIAAHRARFHQPGRVADTLR
jgi:WD40 repeat protein